MSSELKYKLIKIVSYILSIILAFSIVMLTACSALVGICQSKTKIVGSMQKYQNVVIDTVNEKMSDVSKYTDLPAEVFTNALDENTTNVIINALVDNMVYGYSTDFSNNEDLYKCFKSGMTTYCQDNNIKVSSKVIEQNAALAVDIVDEAVGGDGTSSITLFNLSQSKKMMYYIAIPAVLVVACIVLLDLLNFGRHRKFSYIGLGVITSGYVLLLVPLFAKISNLVSKYNFCKISICKLAMQDICNNVLNVCMMVGAALTFVGLIILVLNYSYFKRKNSELKAVHEHNELLRDEYLEHLDELKKDNDYREPEPADKQQTKIDFE